MKKLLIVLILFISAAFVNMHAFYQTEAEALMQNGNSLYQNGDYHEAANVYEEVLNLGFESAALYYNLGNSYFRLNNLGKAILNYEKALKLEPSDDDVNYNLRIAQSRTIDKIQTVPQIFISEWWNILITGFSVSGWGIIFIVFYVLLIFLIGVYFLTRSGRIQRFVFFTGSVNIAILFFVLVLFVSSYNREATLSYGILIEEIVTAKQSPNEQSSDAFVIHEGVKFEIEETLNNWAKIKLADGKVGWVIQNCFEGI